jgi:hypothetical protein
LTAIDPESGKQTADVTLDAHPESFQLETKGKRIFVNVPGAGHVAVVDWETGTVIEKFPLKEAVANFPMALDEANHAAAGFGIATASGAWRSIRRALARIPKQEADQAREAQLARLQAIRMLLWN